MELTEDSKMTLGEWLERWMNEYMIFTIRESTWDSYDSMIRTHVKPYLGDKPVAFITTADVQRMYNKIKKWYEMNLWTAEMVQQAAEKGVITQEQAEEIIKGE